MKIIGLTGGVGSGKSRVLSYMGERWNAVICQADHVAWELQKPGQECYEQIVEHFGRTILNEDLTINRNALGQIVFHNPDELFVLNQIMHPAVKESILRQIQLEIDQRSSCFVLEAALLLEEGYKQICDELWYIYTEETIRRQRLKESRKYSDEKIDAIMSTQLPDELFREQCKIVIDNSGNFDDTYYQIDQEMKRIGMSV